MLNLSLCIYTRSVYHEMIWNIIEAWYTIRSLMCNQWILKITNTYTHVTTPPTSTDTNYPNNLLKFELPAYSGLLGILWYTQKLFPEVWWLMTDYYAPAHLHLGSTVRNSTLWRGSAHSFSFICGWNSFCLSVVPIWVVPVWSTLSCLTGSFLLLFRSFPRFSFSFSFSFLINTWVCANCWVFVHCLEWVKTLEGFLRDVDAKCSNTELTLIQQLCFHSDRLIKICTHWVCVLMSCDGVRVSGPLVSCGAVSDVVLIIWLKIFCVVQINQCNDNFLNKCETNNYY